MKKFLEILKISGSIVGVAAIFGAVLYGSTRVGPYEELDRIKSDKADCIKFKQKFDDVKPTVVSDSLSNQISKCKSVGAWDDTALVPPVKK